MFRTLRRWFADAEIRQLGSDLEKLSDYLQTSAHKLEGLQLRLERLSNRVNMRLNRAGVPRGGGNEPGDDEILDDIRRHSDRDDPFFRQ